MEAVFALIPLLALSIPIVAIWTKHQRRMAEIAHMQTPGRGEAELRAEIADLRERIKVLERIVTDGRRTRELADEIENLR